MTHSYQLTLDTMILLRAISRTTCEPSTVRECDKMVQSLNNPDPYNIIDGIMFKHGERYGTTSKF